MSSSGVAAAGFSLSELCALHLSRTVLTAVAGGPFRDSLASAFDKLYDALPPSMWKFIESLPDALGAKEHAARARGAASAKSIDALMSAILGRRRRADALSLVLQPAGQGLRRRTLSPGLRAGRPVSAGVRARLQRDADVRGAAHRAGGGARRIVQSGRERGDRGLPAFARRVFGNTGNGGDRIHRGRGALRARARVSRVADESRICRAAASG